MVQISVSFIIALASSLPTYAQFSGTTLVETHPPLTWQTCTKSGGCQGVAGSVTLDADWRWIHSKAGFDNCYTGNTWNVALCSDGRSCVANCAIEGADYGATYGITSSGSTLQLKIPSRSDHGSRVFLMASDVKYQLFKLLNQEVSFDVDTSKAPCGFNGAISFVAMDEDGGMARFPTNKAGAKYGTGYCNSKCPRSVKFINGEANVLGWKPSEYDPTSGAGNYGSCCPEVAVWEANEISAAYTARPCDGTKQTRCTGSACDENNSTCDPTGCDFNAFRAGNKTFYGPGGTVNTKAKFTVVTQFITDSGTTNGTLAEIRRIYIQNGQVITNSKVNIPGIPSTYNSITSPYCTEQKKTFGDSDSFGAHGGLAAISKSMSEGMVLSLSLVDDPSTNMLWLDSIYPKTADPSAPGVARGTCPTEIGGTLPVEPWIGPSVIFSNLKIGDISAR